MMHFAPRTLLTAVCAATLLLPMAARAQNWPTKPIRWVVPYTAGGMTDNATRMVLQKITEQAGWTKRISQFETGEYTHDYGDLSS